MKKKALVGGVGSAVAGIWLLVLQNGGLVLGMLTVFQSKLAPEIQAIQQSDVRAAVVGFSVLWIGYGVYRLLKKAVERVQ
jgi:hypothetical protein